jgi:hypothetical protein
LPKTKRTAYQELFLLFLGGFVIETAGLDDFVVDIKLKAGTSIHCFFDALFGYEAQDANSFCLTDTMSTILSLEIGMRIPITIKTAEKRYRRVSSWLNN